ncbi:MAG: hypothetical protein D6679_14620 [Candidatus Hydrogenedentota bacterium]|nr:MAG: hypothetical protein D6679_14620 [Candidatus Hydrogenedentota bacterium]
MMTAFPSPVAPSAPPPPIPPKILRSRRRRKYLFTFLLLFLLLSGPGALLVSRKHLPPPHVSANLTPLPDIADSSKDEWLRRLPDNTFREFPISLLSGWPATDSFPPPELKHWDGEAVVVTGQMIPLDAGEKSRDFVLIADLAYCYFCDIPDPSKFVYARSADPRGLPVSYRYPVKAFGLLRIGEVSAHGRVHSRARLRVVRIESFGE